MIKLVAGITMNQILAGLQKAVFNKFVAVIFAGIFSYLLGVFHWIKTEAQPFLALPDAIESMENSVDQLATEVAKNTEAIRIYSLPNSFFRLSDRSGPIAENCISGQNCLIRLRLRLSPDATGCQIVPGSIAFFYRDAISNETYQIHSVSGNVRQVQPHWSNIEIMIETPFGLSGENEFCMVAAFQGCANQQPGDGSLTQPEECVAIQIDNP